LPDRQVRIHARQQLPQLLQSALALGVDHRLQLPAPVPQRPQPLGGRRRLGIHLGQHLLHLRQLTGAQGLHHQVRQPQNELALHDILGDYLVSGMHVLACRHGHVVQDDCFL